MLGRLEKRHLIEQGVGHRNVEAIAKFAHGLGIELLQLMSRVLALTDLAHAVALDRLGQDHGRLAEVATGGRVRGVDLVRIMSAAIQAPDIRVGHPRHHFQRLRELAEKVLAHEGAIVGLEVLILAVDCFLHQTQQPAILVACQQRIPIRAPDHLEHVPAGAAKVSLQFLDDLAVTAHRTIEPLQIAIDDEDQVVEFFPRRHADGAKRLRLVHLTVTAETPDPAAFGVGDATRVQVLEEARLVDRLDRPESHRDGWELPEIRHQFRMWIGGDALAVDIAPEIQQLLFRQPALEKRARINAGCRVPLDVDQVAAEVRGRCAPEMIEADLHQGADRRITCDVAAEVTLAAIGAHNHRHRVPAHERTDPLLERRIARRLFL